MPQSGNPPALPRMLLALAVLTALPELVLTAADFGLVGSGLWRSWTYQNGAFWAGLLDNWQPNCPAQPITMFLSYAFLHSGPFHLVTNLAVLLGLGPAIWKRSGNFGFLFLYLAAVLGGALVFGLLADSPRPMVGASGGLFGLAGAWLCWDLADRRTNHDARWPIPAMALGLVLLNAITWALQSGALAWETHLGGFIAGWASASVIRRVREGTA